MHESKRETFLNTVVASPLVTPLVRRRLLRAVGIKMGRVTMEHGCRFSGTMISFGYGCYVNVGCFFDTAAAIVVADGVALGSGVRLITSHHEIGPRNRRAGPLSGRPIRIEEGAWLGTGVIVLAGVTIGAGSVVAAGAVVIADCEANTLYGGVPAKRIRSLNQD